MNEWIDLYKSGMSSLKIAQLYNTNPPHVLRYLKKHGVMIRTTSQAAVSLPDSIIDEYKLGSSMRQLAAKYKSTITSISDMFKRLGAEIRPQTKSAANWDFINTKGKIFYYWLGWMLSDGYVTRKHVGGRNRGIVAGLSCHRKDRHIIEFFKHIINPSYTLSKPSNSFALNASIPREIADHLLGWGLVERKSLILTPTANLLAMNDEDFYQMLAGYIEGDGCVAKGGQIGICSGSKTWLEYLATRIGICCSIESHNGSWRVRYKKKDSEILYNRLCQNAPFMLLARKWGRIKSSRLAFFSDELLNKTSICDSMRHHFCKRNKLNGVRPQECEIKLISHKDSSPFYEKFHLMGKVDAKFHIGVFTNNELVAVMSIRKPSRQKSGDWEIARMAANFNHKIYGVWSYVLKWISEHKLISGLLITYSDNRISDGNVYKVIGMTKDRDVAPDYYWVKDGVRYHKSALRKTEAEKATGYTEVQLREEQGYHKVYDYGKIKWSIIL